MSETTDPAVTDPTPQEIFGTVKVENSDGALFISDIEEVEKTTFNTLDGTVVVRHEITLGDVVISSLLTAILIFRILERFIRR